MKRRVCILCVLALIFVLLTACGDESVVLPPELKDTTAGQNLNLPQMTLVVSSWSASAVDYEPTVEEYVFDVNLDLEIHLPESYFFAPNFSVVSVTEEEIVLRSDQPMSLRGESGTINYLSNQQDFIIPYGESITLDTCTMDSGWSYTFTYTTQ